MIEKRTKVCLKESKKNGIIADMWNQDSPYPTGYLVITDDGVHHICLDEDFENEIDSKSVFYQENRGK